MPAVHPVAIFLAGTHAEENLRPIGGTAQIGGSVVPSDVHSPDRFQTF